MSLKTTFGNFGVSLKYLQYTYYFKENFYILLTKARLLFLEGLCTVVIREYSSSLANSDPGRFLIFANQKAVT